MKKRLLIAAASFLLVTLVGRADAQALPSDLDPYIERTMKTFQVPGVAISIVKEGEVLLSRGYGVRRIGRPDPVDEQTLFSIASNGKAFTATALGLLFEEGKLEWDTPVIDVLPWFRLSDPYVTSEVTVRDLLVHRSGLGLGAGDLLWWPETTYDTDEIVRRLRHVPLENSFRATYNYDNVLYVVAGEIIEALSGLPYEEFLRRRILLPLGMKESEPQAHAPIQGENIAWNHARIDGVLQIVSPDTSTTTNAAGNMLSTASDMARWMLVQLGRGKLASGDSLFSQATSRELWTFVTPLPIGEVPPELASMRRNFFGYALGWYLWDYRGHRIVAHGGVAPGQTSRITLVPDLDLGIMVLTNQESAEALNAFTNHILDHYMGAAPYDWVAAYGTVKARQDSLVAAEVAALSQNRDSTAGPSLDLSRYAGTYSDQWYGDVVIEREADGLRIRFSATPALTGSLEHWQYDTFIARWHQRELRADAFVTFDLAPDGSIEQVRMEPVSPTTDFSFDFQDLRLTPRGDQ